MIIIENQPVMCIHVCGDHRRRKEVAEKETGPLTEELKRKFKELSTERDALNAEMEDLNRQALGIQCANPRIMQVTTPKLEPGFPLHVTILLCYLPLGFSVVVV